MEQIFRQLGEVLRTGEDAALITIIESKGSTPRRAGARMLVGNHFKPIGTIGGGIVEHTAQQLGVKAIQVERSFVELFQLNPNKAADIGMICGGKMDVHIQFISAKNKAMLELADDIAKLYTLDRNAWMITEMIDDMHWNMYVYEEGMGLRGTGELLHTDAKELITRQGCLKEMNGKKYYIEPIHQAGVVYIFGGGHVAQALVPVLDNIGFECVVLENRPDFAEPGLFPKAKQTRLLDFTKIDESIQIRSCDYIVIMTRGHKEDFEVAAQALRSNSCYVGMIGSKTKIHATLQRLWEGGLSKEITDKLHSPIGIAIQAETPEEIAISIAAELIRVRSNLK